jgi:DNA-binding MarR family transcriptional regulator
VTDADADVDADADADADAASELRLQLARLTRRLRQEADQRYLTMSQLSVLSRLDRGGAATLTELASHERVRPQSMGKTLDLLEAAGYVVRTPHPTDRRQQLIQLTEQARVAITEDRRRKEAWLATAMSTTLTEEERDLLVRATPLLARLASA